jgi:hypothetical protein
MHECAVGSLNVASPNENCGLWYQRVTEVTAAKSAKRQREDEPSSSRRSKRRRRHSSISSASSSQTDEDDDDEIQEFRRVQIIRRPWLARLVAGLGPSSASSRNDTSPIAFQNGPNRREQLTASQQPAVLSGGPTPRSLRSSTSADGLRHARIPVQSDDDSLDVENLADFLFDNGFEGRDEPQSPTYITELEASFMRDFRCCETSFHSFHDLLDHHELQHSPARKPARESLENLQARFSRGFRPYDVEPTVDLWQLGRPNSSNTADAAEELTQLLKERLNGNAQ